MTPAVEAWLHPLRLGNKTPNKPRPPERHKPSSLFTVRANPLFKRGDHLLNELARFLVGQRALTIEQRRRVAYVRLWLLHRRHVEEHERLAQMMVCPEGAKGAERDADHSARFAAPDALDSRPRADIKSILQHGGHRAVVLGRDEQHAVH